MKVYAHATEHERHADGSRENVFQCASLAGLYLWVCGPCLRWVKSERPVESPAVAVFASVWIDNRRSISVAASFHGAGGNSWPTILDAEPSDAIPIHTSGLEAGRPR